MKVKDNSIFYFRFRKLGIRYSLFNLRCLLKVNLEFGIFNKFNLGYRGRSLEGVYKFICIV